jgi:hypothetical protein
LANRIDPYVTKPRVVVLTDIANEPDDQMSMVRLLVYANQVEIEGLIATTSTWLKERVRPDVIRMLIDAYEQVRPNLLRHQPGFPTADALRGLVTTGPPGYGLAAVGPGTTSPGAELILRAADRDDPRPLWITVWGGANTLAQALQHARATRTPEQVEQLVSKLRVYSISDQDDAGPWIRREFSGIRYIATPSTPNGEQYYFATWTGISGDVFYRNCPGADGSTVTNEWLDKNVRAKGPLGKFYPRFAFIMEGDSPSFLGLIDNGLASAMSPAFGGWGGRYVWRQAYGESRPLWTQGGDASQRGRNSRDTVVGIDGKSYTSDQATIWRWREAFQHDFAARMDWTIKDVREANHNPVVVVNGRAGKAPLSIDAKVGDTITLDATGTRDPDGHSLTYRWFLYPEAGPGNAGRPPFMGGPPQARAGQPGAGVTSPALVGGRPRDDSRIVIREGTTEKATVEPNVPGVAHVILAVEDGGAPTLTSYRRIILNIQAAPRPAR